jgi:Na+/proline symporter
MSSTAGELNALSTTTMNDFVKRLGKQRIRTEEQEVLTSKLITVVWGVLAIGVALAAKLFDNLIELVNLLGSLFYGTILGVFLCAVFLRFLRGTSVFIAALTSEIMVLSLYALFSEEIGYLMFNAIGCGAVLLFSTMIHALVPQKPME